MIDERQFRRLWQELQEAIEFGAEAALRLDVCEQEKATLTGREFLREGTFIPKDDTGSRCDPAR
jgi:hypothetical protein